jgi:hypothetical protein
VLATLALLSPRLLPGRLLSFLSRFTAGTGISASPGLSLPHLACPPWQALFGLQSKTFKPQSTQSNFEQIHSCPGREVELPWQQVTIACFFPVIQSSSSPHLPMSLCNLSRQIKAWNVV